MTDERGRYQRIHKKALSKLASTPVQPQFQTRPFGPGFRERRAELPETNLLQTRPLHSPSQALSSQPEMPDLQTQLEQAENLGYNAANIPLFASETVSVPQVQTKPFITNELTPVPQGAGHIQARGNKQKNNPDKELKANYEAAKGIAKETNDKKEWSKTAVLLNGFNTSDILDRLKELNPDERKAMFDAAPEWVTRVREPLNKLLQAGESLDDEQFKQLKEQSLKDEATRIKELTEKYQEAVKNQEWSQVAVLLNGFSNTDISLMLKKLKSSQRVAMYYTAPEWATRVKEPIAKLDKIAGAAGIEDQEFEQIKKLYQNGVTVAIYVNYKATVDGAAEFKRAGDEFATNQNAIALNGDKIVIGKAIPINELSEVTVAIQRIHLGLVEKYKQAQNQDNADVPLPKFTKIKNVALFAHGEPFGVGLKNNNEFELKLENVKTFVSGVKDALVDDVRVQLFACSTGADRGRVENLRKPLAEKYQKLKNAGKLKDEVEKLKKQKVLGNNLSEKQLEELANNPEKLAKLVSKNKASYQEWTDHDQDERSGADSFAAALATELGSESTVVGHTTVGHTTENFAARVFGKEAGGGTGGLHLFDLMYSEAFIQQELLRLFPDKTDSERADLHESLREQMWAHFQDSISKETKRKGKEKRYSRPMGQETFINPTEAQKLLHEDWEKNWIPNHIKEVKSKSK